MRRSTGAFGIAFGCAAAFGALAACNALTGVGNYEIVSCLEGCGDASGSPDGPTSSDTGTNDATVTGDASDATSSADAADAAPDGGETGTVSDASDGSTDARDAEMDASDAATEAGDASDASSDAGIACVPHGGDGGTVVSLGLGQEHTCVVLDDGTTHCWGDNTYGELGTGDTSTHTLSVPVQNMPSATSVAADTWHTCAIASGAVWCWGGNASSELGFDGGASCTGGACSLLPGLVPMNGPVGPATSLSLAESTFALFDESLWSWGQPIFPSPIPTAAVTAVTSPTIPFSVVDEMSSGTYHACARSGGQLACWGFNDAGQLGRAVTGTVDPEIVSGLTDAAHVCVGPEYTCVLHTGGTVSCFGTDGDGQLGSSASPLCSGQPCSYLPVSVTLPWSAASAITCGDYAACALSTTGGKVACWGRDTEGELGRVGGGTGLAAAEIPSFSGVVQLAAHGSHACAVLCDGTLWCWGANESGQVGDGTSGTGNYVFTPEHIVP